MANYLSLFSGIGGLDLGLDRAGWTCVAQVELDPFCRAVLARHWPEVPRHDDVRTCVEWWLGEPRPAVDMVCGGFPCQPHSLAGKRLAQGDPRWLWPAAWAVVRDLRPQWALLENVPGLLSRGMGDVLGDLAEIGYDAEWDCIPAAALGAPHRRDRVFMVAYPGSQPGRLQPEPQPRSGGTAVAGHDGPNGHVAHTDRGAVESRWWGRHATGGGADGAAQPTPRLDWSRPNTAGQGRVTRRSQASGEAAEGTQDQDGPEFAGGTWWAVEPGLGRVAYGVPGRVDRLRALGNAVVPQVAEHIGRMILDSAVRSHV